MLRELPSLAALVQAISLRDALMPEYAIATIKIRFSQQPQVKPMDAAVTGVFLWRKRQFHTALIRSTIGAQQKPRLSSEAGCGVALLRFAEAERWAMGGGWENLQNTLFVA